MKMMALLTRWDNWLFSANWWDFPNKKKKESKHNRDLKSKITQSLSLGLIAHLVQND